MAAGTLARKSWCLLLLCGSAASAQPDTLAAALSSSTDSASARPLAVAYLYGSLSASYAVGENWNGQDVRQYAFVGDLLYRHTLDRGARGHLHQVLADLGYLKLVDSAWVKHLDRLQVSGLWSAKGRRWQRSWTAALSTQFLPATTFGYEEATGGLREQRVGGFLNPFTLDAGYGAVLSFWDKCAVNLAFATVRFTGSPKQATAPAFSEAPTAESGQAYYFLSYGFSIGTLIDRSFGPHLQWLNTTRCFGNGLDRDHVNLDLSNMLIVKPWKYLQLRIDTRLAYDPLRSYDLQFRQEVLIGFFYERTR